MDRPPDNADPAPETLTELILRASAQVSSTLGIRLKPLGVQVDEMRVLHALNATGSAGSGMSMTELSEALVIGGPTLTRMADRLVSENLVYRAPDPHDRRRVRLHLTDTGAACAAEAAEIVADMQQLLTARFAGLDLDDLSSALARTASPLKD